MSYVLERFMRYVQVGSPSNPDNMDETPSTPCQHDMARLLGEELRAVGCTDVSVDQHAYVTGTLPASAESSRENSTSLSPVSASALPASTPFRNETTAAGCSDCSAGV